MKKIVIIISACIAFSACTKNINDVETPQTQGTPATFTAVTEDMDNLTKTAYENGLIKWFKNDKIKVLYHTSNSVEKCEFTNQADAGKTASFSGNLGDTKVAGEPFYAVYPTTGSNYDLTAEGKVKFTVTNNTQNITQAYSFAQGANYTFAATVDDESKGGNTLYFKNAQSIIKFTVPATLAGKEELVSVALTPNNENYSFNGTYTCAWDVDGNPFVEFSAAAGVRTVIATNGQSGGWGENKPYYVTIPPMTYEDGIMVDITLKADKHIVRYNFNDFTAVRAKMHNIGTLPTTPDLLAVNLNVDEVPAFFTSKNDCSMDGGMLKVDKTSTTSSTTGFFTIDTKKACGETAYDASVFNTVRFKIKYNPQMAITSGDHKVKVCMQVSGGTRVLASRVNGKKQDGEEYVVKTDGSWNIVELDIKEMNSGYSTINNKQITICPFGGDLDASFNSMGTNRVCWIKDFEFIKK